MIYHIRYNDGAFYGKLHCHYESEQVAEEAIAEEIERNNSNQPNPLYHISRKNFKKIDDDYLYDNEGNKISERR